MPFITKSNAEKLIKQIDFGKSVNLTGMVYDKYIEQFSKKEKQKLLAIRQLYEHPDEFVEKKYQKLVKVDSMKYVFEGGIPAFHENADCVKLISRFTNYEIPRLIIEKGPESVNKFRRWFRDNPTILENKQIYDMRLHAAFGISSTLVSVETENSGIELIENMDLATLEKNIDELINEIQLYYEGANDEKKYVINNFVKSTSIAYGNIPFKNNTTRFSDQTIKNFLVKYDEKFKRPLKKYLKQYYRVKLNPTLCFEGDLLTQLGFKKCSSCCQ